jgi:hypothetical protein
MDSQFDRTNSRLTLTFASPADLERFITSARQESGFLVELPQGLALHLSVTVVLAQGERSTAATANVAQVFDKGFGRFGIALLIEEGAFDGPGLAAEEVPGEGEDEPEPDEAEPDEPPPAESATSESETRTPDYSRAEGETKGLSPIHRIRQMNPRKRSMLAMRANRTERKILLQDHSAMVLQGLLANPQLDSEDVLRIARSSHVVFPILQRLVQDPRWSSNQELLALIARNPRTPTPFAVRMMPSLRTSDLRSMAKMSSGLKQMPRKAALREYLRRSGQKP